MNEPVQHRLSVRTREILARRAFVLAAEDAAIRMLECLDEARRWGPHDRRTDGDNPRNRAEHAAVDCASYRLLAEMAFGGRPRSIAWQIDQSLTRRPDLTANREAGIQLLHAQNVEPIP